MACSADYLVGDIIYVKGEKYTLPPVSTHMASHNSELCKRERLSISLKAL